MKCPIDTDTDLVMNVRQGIEVEYCPKCRGVWLDRGEIDKIIERSLGSTQRSPVSNPQHFEQPHGTYPGRHEYDDDDDDHRPHRKHKTTWLSELFD